MRVLFASTRGAGHFNPLNRRVFGRLNTTASLPRLREACGEWRPDVVVRESSEFGSAIAAELHEMPVARVGLGLAALEEVSLGIAAGPVDSLRRAAGLPGDPEAQKLRHSP
jgi:hypothetical protein